MQVAEFARVAPIVRVDCILALMEVIVLQAVRLDGQVFVLVLEGHRLGLHLVRASSIGVLQPRLLNIVVTLVFVLLGLSYKLSPVITEPITAGPSTLLAESLRDSVPLLRFSTLPCYLYALLFA